MQSKMDALASLHILLQSLGLKSHLMKNEGWLTSGDAVVGLTGQAIAYFQRIGYEHKD